MRAKLTIQKAAELASSRGGKILSTEWNTALSKYEWECRDGHRWSATYGNISQGKWCPKCAKVARVSEEDFHTLALKSGFCCLAVGSNTKARATWQCSTCQHVWKAAYYNIQSGRGCPKCAGKMRVNDGAYRDLAKERGIELLAAGKTTMHRSVWRCLSCKMEWATSYNKIRSGTGCPSCKKKSAIDKIRLPESAYFSVGADRGVVCLRPATNSKDSDALWKCIQCNNEWRCSYGSLRNGHGCPNCSSGFRERACRRHIEELTGLPFPKVRPEWLSLSSSGDKRRRLELDGYNSEVKIAFEYQGIQHYHHVPYFHRGGRSLAIQQARDLAKKRLCEDRGVWLIEIPYRVRDSELRNFISRELLASGRVLVQA